MHRRCSASTLALIAIFAAFVALGVSASNYDDEENNNNDFSDSVSVADLSNPSLPTLDPRMPSDVGPVELLELLTLQQEEDNNNNGEEEEEEDGEFSTVLLQYVDEKRNVAAAKKNNNNNNNNKSPLLCPSVTSQLISPVLNSFPSKKNLLVSAAKNLGLEGMYLAVSAATKSLSTLENVQNLKANFGNLKSLQHDLSSRLPSLPSNLSFVDRIKARMNAVLADRKTSILRQFPSKEVRFIRRNLRFPLSADVPEFPVENIPAGDKFVSLLSYRSYLNEAGQTGSKFSYEGQIYRVLGDFVADNSKNNNAKKLRKLAPRAQVIQSETDGDLVVVFRGGSSLYDAVSDLRSVPRPFNTTDGRFLGNVHAGTKHHYQAVRKQTLDALFTAAAATSSSHHKVVFVGHGLGAAIATVAAADFVKDERFARFSNNIKVSITTMGAPAFTDAVFNQNLVQSNNVESIVRYVTTVQRIAGGPIYEDPVTTLRSLPKKNLLGFGESSGAGEHISSTDVRYLPSPAHDVVRKSGKSGVGAVVYSHFLGYLVPMSGGVVEGNVLAHKFREVAQGNSESTFIPHEDLAQFESDLESDLEDVDEEGNNNSNNDDNAGVCDTMVDRVQQITTRFLLGFYNFLLHPRSELQRQNVVHLGAVLSRVAANTAIVGCFDKQKSLLASLAQNIDESLQKVGELPIPPTHGWNKEELRAMRELAQFEPMVKQLRRTYIALLKGVEQAEGNEDAGARSVADLLAESPAVRRAELILKNKMTGVSANAYKAASSVIRDVDDLIFRQHCMSERAATVLSYRAESAMYILHRLAKGVGAQRLMRLQKEFADLEEKNLTDDNEEDEEGDAELDQNENPDEEGVAEIEDGFPPVLPRADLSKKTGIPVNVLAVMEEHCESVRRHALKIGTSAELTLNVAAASISLGARTVDNLLCGVTVPSAVLSQDLSEIVSKRIVQLKSIAVTKMSGAFQQKKNSNKKSSADDEEVLIEESDSNNNDSSDDDSSSSSSSSSAPSAGDAYSSSFEQTGSEIVTSGRVAADARGALFAGAPMEAAVDDQIIDSSQRTRSQARDSGNRDRDQARDETSQISSDIRSGTSHEQDAVRTDSQDVRKSIRSEAQSNRDTTRNAEDRIGSSIDSSTGNTDGVIERSEGRQIDAIDSDTRLDNRAAQRESDEVHEVRSDQQQQRMDRAIRREEDTTTGEEKKLSGEMHNMEERRDFSRLEDKADESSRSMKDKMNRDNMDSFQERKMKEFSNLEKRQFAREGEEQRVDSMLRAEERTADTKAFEERQFDDVQNKMKSDEKSRREKDRLERMDKRVTKDFNNDKQVKEKIAKFGDKVEKDEERAADRITRETGEVKNAIDRTSSTSNPALAAEKNADKIRDEISQKNADGRLESELDGIKKTETKEAAKVRSEERRGESKIKKEERSRYNTDKFAKEVSDEKKSIRNDGAETRDEVRTDADDQVKNIKSAAQEAQADADASGVKQEINQKAEQQDKRSEDMAHQIRDESRASQEQFKKETKKIDERVDDQKDDVEKKARNLKEQNADEVDRYKQASEFEDARIAQDMGDVTDNSQKQELKDTADSFKSFEKDQSKRMDRSMIRNQQRDIRKERRTDDAFNRENSRVEKVGVEANRNSNTPTKRRR